MVLPSTKERDVDVIKVGSNKEVIKSSVETEVEEMERKTSYADIVH